MFPFDVLHLKTHDTEFRDEYKFLEITLYYGTNCLLMQEQMWKREANKCYSDFTANACGPSTDSRLDGSNGWPRQSRS